MKTIFSNRRSFLIRAGLGGAALATGAPCLIAPVWAQQGLAATASMRSGRNNYVANAPLVENLGSGFRVFGTVCKAGTGEPFANVCIQIWAATTLGGDGQ